MSESKRPLTYAAVGIDLERRRGVVERYKSVSAKARRPEVLDGIGPFAGLFALGKTLEDPVIVASTDGVGTKVKLAALAGEYESIGHDVVNQSVNDVLTTGAEPLFFLDYIASSDLTADAKVALVKGIADACADVNCALLGGETSDMPDVYASGDYDIVGFLVGAVDRSKVIDGSRIQDGDLLFGLPSSGLHTNGFTLARSALELGVDARSAERDRKRLNEVDDRLGESLGAALLKPHLSYVNDLRPALALINGMAHITAGGFEENIPRVLPDGLGAEIRSGSWTIPPVFGLIQEAGNIEEEEMFRVFNMGIGMVLMTSPDNASNFQKTVPAAIEIGRVEKLAGDGARVRRI